VIGRMNRGWSRVVGMLDRVCVKCNDASPIWGIDIDKARWSLWLVSEAVMVASVDWKCADGGRRRSRWSRGELVGMYVGVWGSPMWVSDVVL
jgi:hypothetical protein